MSSITGTSQSRSTPGIRGRRPKLRPGQIVKSILGYLTTLVLLGILAGIAYTFYLIRSTAEALPATDSLADYLPGGVTEIYATDKDPKTGSNYVLGRFYTQFKEFAPITDIPDKLKDATVAIEDERFYDHVGIDIRGTGRALYRDVIGHKMGEGGSTLTQQLARGIFLSRKKNFNRKLKEAILAIELEKNFSKEQILEMYLNEVCYGNNTYGVKAAAKIYFGKPLDKLTVAEAALLAGLPQSPTEHDPFRHLDSALRRRNDVLAHMAEQHYITPEQEATALADKPKLIPLTRHRQAEFKAPYFVWYIRDLVIKKYGIDQFDNGGLKIYTTLNYQMQQEGENALENGVLDGVDSHVAQGALVSLEPRTGYIRTMVGGVDWKKNEYNNAAQGKRQPGSSFKAFVYTTAFRLQPRRFDPDTEIEDEPVTFGKGKYAYSPKNFEGRFEGSMSIRNAFAHSVNVVAVKVANMVGIKNVIETARLMGIHSKLTPDLSLALGSSAVSPLEMASAYSVFPNRGSHAEPMGIIRILDGDGKVLESNSPQVQQAVIPEHVVDQMDTLTLAVVEHGTAAGAKGIHDVEGAHGKTGTTNDNRDAWFIGYTPELTTAVWCSGEKLVPGKKGKLEPKYPQMVGATGGVICAPIWARFMKAAVPIQRQAGLATPAPKASAADTPKIIAHRSSTPTPDPNDRPVPAIADDNVAMPTPDATPTPDSAAQQPNVQASPTPDSGALATAERSSGLTGVVPGRSTTDAAIADGAATSIRYAAPTPIQPLPARGAPLAPIAGRTTRAAHAARTVTVTLCEESGLLATRWCPATVSRTVPADQAPHKYCTKHRAQPGDQ